MTPESNNTPAVEFRKVFLTFDGRRVLNDISFKVAEGEMIFLTGVSGSGKSVLLRLAMGLLKPDAGQIFAAALPLDVRRGFAPPCVNQ
jgi:phospholipid/cholesterol/gamma-HCH transport system ATP-binding protein